MRYSEPSQETPAETTEQQLRKRVEDLERQLKERGHSARHSDAPTKLWRPSAITLWALFLGVAVLLVVAFFAGYIPLQKRQTLILAESLQQEQALPRVEVIQVRRSSGQNQLELPGSIQAITEAPILARADGYIKRRMVDIGDRVSAGQVVAEIEAPELDQQVLQAKAAAQQAEAALDQAQANRDQGVANMNLARVTASRWKDLAAQGVVSQQDNDTYQAQYLAQTANVQALEKAIAAQRANIAAAEANVKRLEQMQSYTAVRAPFDGVITLRNVDSGALVTTGSTLLYRIAQTSTLRAYVNVPQSNAASVHAGQPARLTVSTFPSRSFAGTVARTANALDPNSRTLLVEVDVPNADGVLLPGMYAQVDFNSSRATAPMLVPADTLIVRADGTQVAILRADHTVHLQKIEIGRDYGDRLEVARGLEEGDTIIVNPGDAVREGAKVEPIPSTP
ncbi:MAG TPA: efflux RND transporter periplasmic adaptor subunit [Bryobacteraceae bacterium]|nr:efflux RND transporter periplasmic adaptor subunit [Bryobacteraceae bacterium]